eukprot:gene14920-33307_t
MSSEPAAKRQRKEGSSPAEIAADLAECSKQLSSKMREVRDSKAKVSKTSDPAHQAKIMECLLLFVDLKRLVRTGFENVQQATETTGKKRAEVDALHLSLQNLLYEKTHILKEIKRCHLFRSSHDDIEMIPEAQFVSESSADAKVLAADPHKKMLARLDHEGKERNRLALQLKGLKNTKDSLEKEIEAREAKLTKLPQKVKKIVEDVADDLYPLIGEGNELSFNDAQKRDFESLPMPLYLLYMNLEAHKQRKFGGPGSIVVTVEGDVEAAKEQLLQVATELTTDDGAADDDAEETGDVADAAEDEAAADGGSSRGNSKGGSAAAQHTPLVDVFPLRLNLKLLVGGGGAAAADAEQQFIEIQFCYLRKLNVVTVVNVGEVDNHELLSSLYPGDDGLDLPSTRALYELDAATKKLFSEFVTTVGRPYKWAQSVADLDADRADADMEECGGRVAKRETRQTLTRVIADIRHKVKSVHALGEQLKALAKLNIELPASATAKNFPLEAKSVLQSWKRCDKVPAAQLSPYLIKPGNSYV